MVGNPNQKSQYSGDCYATQNQILEVLLSHRSIRKYKDKPIPQEALNQILKAAQRAPTSCNYQSYSIIVVDSLAIRKRIRDLSGNQAFVADCGMLLIFCADISRLVYTCKKQGYRFGGDHLDTLLTAHGDALIACQNAAVAAESMGFGTCIVGNIRNNPQAISDLLELPQYVFATVGFTVGFSDEDPDIKPRFPQQAIAFRNKYCTHQIENRLVEYDHVMCCSGIYKGRIQSLHTVDPNLKEKYTENNYGWIEHTARRLASSIQHQRRELANFLKRKGFTLE